MKTLKLLILTNNAKRGSIKDRIGTYIDFLRARKIEPTLVELDRFISRRIRLYRQADDYEVVLLHKKCLNRMDALFFNPRKSRVIFNYDDAVMFNDKGRATRTHQARFRRSLQKAGTVLVGSSYLADQARPFHSNVVILPIGLNTQQYVCDRPKNEGGKIRLVWIGSTATLPYIRELAPVIRDLAKKYSNLVLRLIGDDFFDIEGVSIEKIKWTPHSRSHCIGECDIGLAPLPDTPFTRGKCSFKVLEYSASGIPVVASPVGTNPDHIREGVTGFLADKPDEWIPKLSLLIEDQPRRIEMGRQGLKIAGEYDVSVIGKKLCDLFFQVAGW